MTIYLNACSHGLPSDATLARMADHIALERTVGLHRAFARVRDEVAGVTEAAVRLIGAAPGTVGLAPSTTAAWLPLALRLPRPGKRVLVAPHEWWANLGHMRVLCDAAGARLEVLPALEPGDAGAEAWAARLDEDVAALCLPMVSSIEGRRYPVEAIGAMPRPEGCRLVVDGAQALGQVPVDVRRLGCDVFAATARKWLRAPRGTALWWTRGDMGVAVGDPAVEPSDAMIPLRLGLGHAIGEALRKGVPAIAERIAVLRARAERGLRAAGLEPVEGRLPVTGALAVRVSAPQAARLAPALEAADMVVKFPLTARDEPEAGLPAHVMRVAPHIYNTEAEIDAFCARVRELL